MHPPACASFGGNEPPFYLVITLVRAVTIHAIGVILRRRIGKRSRRGVTSSDRLIVIVPGAAMGDVLF